MKEENGYVWVESTIVIKVPLLVEAYETSFEDRLEELKGIIEDDVYRFVSPTVYRDEEPVDAEVTNKVLKIRKVVCDNKDFTYHLGF